VTAAIIQEIDLFAIILPSVIFAMIFTKNLYQVLLPAFTGNLPGRSFFLCVSGVEDGGTPDVVILPQANPRPSIASTYAAISAYITAAASRNISESTTATAAASTTKDAMPIPSITAIESNIPGSGEKRSVKKKATDTKAKKPDFIMMTDMETKLKSIATATTTEVSPQDGNRFGFTNHFLPRFVKIKSPGNVEV
jgi:hypothetical protein